MQGTFLKLFASLLLAAEGGVFLLLSASLFIPLEAAAQKSFSNPTVEFEIQGHSSAIQIIRESQLARNLDLTGDGKPEIVLAHRRPNGDILEFGVRHAIFANEQDARLINPTSNSLAWALDVQVPEEFPVHLVALTDITNDRFEELTFFLPQTKQVQVWGHQYQKEKNHEFN